MAKAKCKLAISCPHLRHFSDFKTSKKPSTFSYPPCLQGSGVVPPQNEGRSHLPVKVGVIFSCYPETLISLFGRLENHEVSRTWHGWHPNPQACLRSTLPGSNCRTWFPEESVFGEIFRPRFCLHLIAGNSIFFFGHIDSGYLRKMTCSGVLSPTSPTRGKEIDMFETTT